MSYPYSGSGYTFSPTAFQAALATERARSQNLENQLRLAKRANNGQWIRRVIRIILTIFDPTGFLAAIGLELAYDWIMTWWDA